MNMIFVMLLGIDLFLMFVLMTIAAFNGRLITLIGKKDTDGLTRTIVGILVVFILITLFNIPGV